MRSVFALVIAAVCSAGLWPNSVQADDGPFRLIPTAKVVEDGGTSVEVTPVRWGFGWRGAGYYLGPARPYATYGYGGYGYRPYGAYYGGYAPYYSGYAPYYSGYAPYYGGYYSGYRGYYGPRVGVTFGWY